MKIKQHVLTIEQFLNEQKKVNPKKLNEGMSRSSARKYYGELINLSSEELNFRDYKEYITDYYENWASYNIDQESKYFQQIEDAYYNMDSSYDAYKKLF